MKITLVFAATLIINTLLCSTFSTNAIAKNHISTLPSFQKESLALLGLREDLPSYVFEYELEKRYPATYEFYKKLGIINRDKIYAYYLYHPNIKNVRHKIIELAIGKKKSKAIPMPFSLNQALIAIKITEKTKQSSNALTLRASLFN